MPNVKELISDEKQAVKDYGVSARNAKKKQAQRVFRHIQSQEREHARELETINASPAAKRYNPRLKKV